MLAGQYTVNVTACTVHESILHIYQLQSTMYYITAVIFMPTQNGIASNLYLSIKCYMSLVVTIGIKKTLNNGYCTDTETVRI